MNTPTGILAALEEQGVRLAGLTDDSRQVRPGDIFLAYPSERVDLRRYIPDALARGAAAVIWEPGGEFAWKPEWKVPQVSAAGLRALAGPLAHRVCGFPTDALSLVAVTGTNGKTTVTQWIARAHAKFCGVIGTLGAGLPGALVETGFTTPEATTLMRALQQMRQQGALACALEASSIGIEEGRMNGAHVDVAVFTNFTRDHLDYHGSMEAYAEVKAKLFRWPRLRLAVVNLDDELGVRLARETEAAKVLGYTIGDEHHDVPAVIRAVDLEVTPEGQQFTLVTPVGRVAIETGLIGRFNISNLLAVAAVLVDAGMTVQDIARRLSQLEPPPGRLERLGGSGEPLIAIDYAHTPDALEKALVATREVAAARRGRLWAVFGCGGDRDRGKRPLMGELAAQLADVTILTSDNPRSEDPETILADIRVGAPVAEVVVDRAAAIRRAVLGADAKDVVLLAGKGHETYQEMAGRRAHFSDIEQARAALLSRRRRESGTSHMRWHCADIAASVGGQLYGPNVEIDSISTDTRQIALGSLFVALAGEHFDAHRFLLDAVKGGASALMVSNTGMLPADVPAIVVDDTRLALGRLAAAWRRSFDLPVLAVTGSNGKTTTKEMIAAILRAAFGEHVLATTGNLNNDVGLPLTLLRLREHHRAAVIEMGMNHPGEIALLAAVGAPTAAVVTNAQRAHLQGMGGVDAVALEKGSLFGGLIAGGVAVINADDPFADIWRDQTAGLRRLEFGLDRPAEVRGLIRQRGLDQNLRIEYDCKSVDIELRVPGRHNARNALAAAAICLAAGLSLADVCVGLSAFSGVSGRLQRRLGFEGAQLLDDTYNANPDSVRAGIDVLAATVGKKILVLGDMGEIGEASAQYHDEIGGYAKSQGIDHLFALGEAAQQAVRNFGDGGSHFADVNALIAALLPFLDADTTVLVKGSRFMKMERVADAIAADKNESGGMH